MKKLLFLVGCLMVASRSSALANDTGQVVCTLEYAPVCGIKQVQCVTTPCHPVTQTYGNRCQMEADGAEFAYAGECAAVSANCNNVYDPVCGSNNISYDNSCVASVQNGVSVAYSGACSAVGLEACARFYDGCNTCAVTSGGKLTACTEMACEERGEPRCLLFADKVYYGGYEALNTGHKQIIHNVLDRVFAPWRLMSLDKQEPLFRNFLEAIVAKIRQARQTLVLADFSGDAFHMPARKLAVYQYVAFWIQSLLADMGL